MPGKYHTAQAFRQALDARLAGQSLHEGVNLQRLQRRVAFERLLARLFADDRVPWILKGGYSLELRLHGAARATIDLDLSVPVPNPVLPTVDDHPRIIRELLQTAIERDLGDSFSFLLSTSDRALHGPPYGGVRFSIDARLDNRRFTNFHLDVAVGDVLIGEPDRITGHDDLLFAGIDPARVIAVPVQQHFAEKIHAFTLPRAEANSRIKDLVDLVLLIDYGMPDPDLVAQAVRATFERRKTHNAPSTLPDPPAAWRETYASLALRCGVSKTTLEDAADYTSSYWKALNI